MTGPPSPHRSAPPRRTFALIVLGVAAFTVYGSLVPLTFRARPFGEAVDSFRWAMINRAAVESRTDGVVNMMLGVPLGFGLLGLGRVGTERGVGDVIVGALLLPACVGFAAAVEFAQLYVPVRTCAGSDVWCQGLGAAAGMAGWVWFGRWLTEQAQGVWGRTQAAGPAARLLPAYLVLLAFVQALPLDLSPGPKDVYRKLRDQVRFVPFEEILDAHGDESWTATAKLLRVAGLYLPAGLLAARLPGPFWGRRNFPLVIATAVGLACGMEAIQLLVQSRVPSATDVIAGACGGVAGWWIGRRGEGGPNTGRALALGSVWAVVLVLAYWDPFDFSGPAAEFDWLPGMPLESGNPLNTLEMLLTKLILFAPFGVLVVAGGRGRPGRSELLVAAGIGAAVAAVIEAGQVYLPAHSPSITDVLIGGAGAVAGAWVAGAVFGGAEILPE
ncbi:MAG: VanZ like family protein [Gemmataceae bacterium]|nr:VanZ like family protein [Gemmataceae bacterium]